MADDLNKLDLNLWGRTYDRNGVSFSTDYVRILVDQKPLVDLLEGYDDIRIRQQSFERTQAEGAAMGRQLLDRDDPKWHDLLASELLGSPSLFGVAGPEGAYFSGEPTTGIVTLLACGCGETGCEAVIADFTEDAGRITWSRLRTATAASHPPAPRFAATPPPDLVFDSARYRDAVARALNESQTQERERRRPQPQRELRRSKG